MANGSWFQINQHQASIPENTKWMQKNKGTFCSNCKKITEFYHGKCSVCGKSTGPKTKAISKTTAIILNIIFGIFGWFYTIKVDAWRMLIGMFFIFVLDLRLYFVGLLWAACQAILRKPEFYKEYRYKEFSLINIASAVLAGLIVVVLGFHYLLALLSIGIE